MSTLGFGFVLLPLALPLIATAGVGIMAVQGVMWCGDKLQDHYEDACHRWTQLMDAAWAEHLSQAEALPDRVAAALARSAEVGVNLRLSGGGAAEAEAAELAALLAAVRTGPVQGAADAGDARPPDDPARAQALLAIEAADRQLQALREQPAAAEAWLARRRDVVRIQSVLHSLDTMSREMSALALADEAAVASVAARIAAAGRAAEAHLEQGPGGPDTALSRLAGDVDGLEREVFGMARRGQRDRIGATLAATLGDLGYRSPDGEAPAVEWNGDFADVGGLRTTDGSERSVRFAVGLDGGVTYDLSGYVGDACREDAAELFGALRARGILVLGGVAAEELERRPPATLTPAVVSQLHSGPEPGQLKEQAQVAARLLEALHRMGFAHVTQSATAGTIDIEGFNGDVGYRIVLPSDGHAEVTRSGEDVSTDADDPVVAETSMSRGSDVAAVARQRKRVKDALGRSARRQSEDWRRQREALRQ
jgi:hypothetical protein